MTDQALELEEDFLSGEPLSGVVNLYRILNHMAEQGTVDASLFYVDTGYGPKIRDDLELAGAVYGDPDHYVTALQLHIAQKYRIQFKWKHIKRELDRRRYVYAYAARKQEMRETKAKRKKKVAVE